MAVSADIFDERDSWRGPVGWSVALHGALVLAIAIWGVVAGFWRGSAWGGGGGMGGAGAISATLVSSVPLPQRQSPTENVLATESPGLSQSLPKQKEET